MTVIFEVDCSGLKTLLDGDDGMSISTETNCTPGWETLQSRFPNQEHESGTKGPLL